MKSQFELRNNLVILGWVLMSVWILFLVIFTWIFFRDHGFRQFSYEVEIAILICFWIFGFGGAAQVFTQPRTHLKIGYDGRVTLKIASLTDRRTLDLTREELAQTEIRTDFDSDGDSYSLMLKTNRGESFVLKTSNDRGEIEAIEKELKKKSNYET